MSNQLALFDLKPSPVFGSTVIWDGKRVPIDDAIKLAKLQVNLAPSFPKYRRKLEFLMSAKGSS
jgi:hypothetical protein